MAGIEEFTCNLEHHKPLWLSLSKVLVLTSVEISCGNVSCDQMRKIFIFLHNTIFSFPGDWPGNLP